MSMNHRPRTPGRFVRAAALAWRSRQLWLRPRAVIDRHNLMAAWHASDRSYFERLAKRWPYAETDPLEDVLRPIDLPIVNPDASPSCVECPECGAEVDTRRARAL